MKNKIKLYNEALKRGAFPCEIKRTRRGYCLRVAATVTAGGSAETLSDVKLLDFGGSKAQVRLDAVSRYGAQAFLKSDTVWINPRYAMKMPNWGGRFGGLWEVANAMKRAKLISA